MKKLFLLAVVLGLLVSGCVGSTGWARKDGKPVDRTQFEKDREECNRGWGICLTVDILVTGGFVSLIHYFEARHCMKVKDYVKEVPKEKITIQQDIQPKEEVISKGKEDKQEVMAFDRAPDSGLYYHRTDCTVGLKIHSRRYMTKEQAEKKGLRPCPICKP